MAAPVRGPHTQGDRAYARPSDGAPATEPAGGKPGIEALRQCDKRLEEQERERIASAWKPLPPGVKPTLEPEEGETKRTRWSPEPPKWGPIPAGFGEAEAAPGAKRSRAKQRKTKPQPPPPPQPQPNKEKEEDPMPRAIELDVPRLRQLRADNMSFRSCAEALGMGYSTLFKKIQEAGLRPCDFPESEPESPSEARSEAAEKSEAGPDEDRVGDDPEIEVTAAESGDQGGLSDPADPHGDLDQEKSVQTSACPELGEQLDGADDLEEEEEGLADEADEWELLERSCRACGCTDDDCSGCMLRTGAPCFWVADDLCSACASPPSDTSAWLRHALELEQLRGDLLEQLLEHGQDFFPAIEGLASRLKVLARAAARRAGDEA